MDVQIRITPGQMQAKATQYRTQADTINGVIMKLDSLLLELQDEWEGSASVSYATRFQELRPAFTQAEDLIREIADSLDSVGQIAANMDSDIAGQFMA